MLRNLEQGDEEGAHKVGALSCMFKSKKQLWRQRVVLCKEEHEQMHRGVKMSSVWWRECRRREQQGAQQEELE